MNKEMFKKSPKRLNKEKKERLKERDEYKQKLSELALFYKDKTNKIKYLKKIETQPVFQKEYNQMKQLLTGYNKLHYNQPKDYFNIVNEIQQKKQKKKTNKDMFDGFFKL